MGKFEVLLNKVSKKGETKSVPATPKKEVNGFALFVKENYGSVKKSNLKHGEVMKLLGQKFQEMKVNNKNWPVSCCGTMTKHLLYKLFIFYIF